MDYNLLNLLFKNNITYIKKFNFKRKLKKYKTLFIKSVKHIGDIKLTGCNLSDASNWLLDNDVPLENEFNGMNVECRKYKSIKFNNRLLPRIYLFCLCFFQNHNNLFEEKSFFEKLSEYERDLKLDLSEIFSVPFFVKYTLLERICELTNEVLNIEKEKFRSHEIFLKVFKSISCGKCEGGLKKLSNYFNDSLSLYSLEYFMDLVYEARVSDTSLDRFLNNILKNEKLTYEDLKRLNSKKLSELRMNISMCILSLKNVSSLNWKYCLEEISSVHREFLKDPSCIYPKMDYESRQFYRKTFEKLCRENKLDETFECKKILDMCKKGVSDYSRHVGYYLLDKGSKYFRKNNIYNLSIKLGYFICIFFGIIFLLIFIPKYFSLNVDNVYLNIFSIFILFILSSDTLINFVNYLFLKNTGVRFIPRMDYTNKIPDEAKTVVVIPAMLSNREDIDNLFKNLEISYICNRNNNIYFSLLLDYVDTISYEGSEDKSLLNYANTLLKNLNEKYENFVQETKFYMFVRNKIYNKRNKIYMGWERKRGKILEFIKFLKGEKTNFNGSIEEYGSLKNVKYIITIDSDTKLMKDSAVKLIGTIHHILNRAVVKNLRNANKVVRGYGIVQPRVNISFNSSINTLYSKIFVGSVATSSYNYQVSNIYQDIFGDGIFMGKGIIDVDVFNSVMNGVIPENKILSHDLIEGCFSKVLFASNIQIEEDFPSNALSSFLRLHRWIRGDWQLIYYFLKAKQLNFISKYKIFDNLRISIIPVCYLISFLLPIRLSLDRRNIYYGLIFSGLIFPVILDVSSLCVIPIFKRNLQDGVINIKNKFLQIYINLSFLPYHAYICVDAIIRALFRMVFTKKNLLEWKSFQETERDRNKSFSTYLKKMISCEVFALLFFSMGVYFRAYPIVFVSITFLIAPIVAYFISRGVTYKSISIKRRENVFLRAVARSIFAYFEDFTSNSTNYLVCDNYQECPYIGVVKRTSPTNIGMSLNAFVLGRDFGFISIFNMVDILKKIFNSIDLLPSYRGHLYNWYDIEKFTPLGNRFISTVDSGNLLSSYYLCRKSLEDILNMPILHRDLIKSFEEMAYLSCGFSDDHLYKQAIDYGYSCKEYRDYIKFLEMIIDVSNNSIPYLNEKEEDVYWHIKINESANEFLNEVLYLTCEMHKLPNFKLDKFGEIFLNTNLISLGSVISDFLGNYNNLSVKDENTYLKISEVFNNVVKLIDDVKFLIENISLKINNMDFKFLYNQSRNLLSIGYDCENDILDRSCYDLLASECRIASFLSIAKGDVPIEHWFNLGRPGVKIGKCRTILSWNGTMFEYLMPMLYMKAYPETLLYEAYSGCFTSQFDFGNNNNIPFGISESCFYKFDGDSHYQYRAFGVPIISIKNDCTNMVVSPYSSIMSLMVDFKKSMANLKSLEKLGCVGKYGFYEAIDFTKGREEEQEPYYLVKSYMAHHQGMSFMALANILMENVCQNRFGSIPEVKSVDEILNEDISNVCIANSINKPIDVDSFNLDEEFAPRTILYNNEELCHMQIYSNGEYSLGISSSGGGFSKFKGRYISKASHDFTNEKFYGCVYINDLSEGKIFSNTYLPCKNDFVEYVCEFGIDKVKFTANSSDLRVISEILVSSDDNVEVRKVVLKNLTSRVKCVDIHSYFESDDICRGFEYIDKDFIGICRDKSEEIYIAHSVFLGDNNVKEANFSHIKEKFIGINGNLQNPSAMHENIIYSNGRYSEENILSIRCSVNIDSYGHISLYFINSIACTKKEAVYLINKYKNINLLVNICENNFYNFKSTINSLGICYSELMFFNHCTSRILYGYNKCGSELSLDINVNNLLSHGIDPRIPIVAIEVVTSSDMDNLEMLLKLFSYFRNMDFEFNLIILNGNLRYDKQLDKEIEDMIIRYDLKDRVNVSEGIYIILSNLYKSTYEIVKGISNIFIKSSNVSVYEQLDFSVKDINNFKQEMNFQNWVQEVPISIENVLKDININNYLFEVSNGVWDYTDVDKYTIPKRDIKFYNSYGGFSKDCSEYIVKLNNSNLVPHSYRNILGNKHISTCILSNGFMSTHAFECGEFSITEDLSRDINSYLGECIYLKEDNCVWSPTLNPMNNSEDYIISNSTFSTKINNKFNNLITEVECFVPNDGKYKVVSIKFKNLSDKVRDLSICYFVPISLNSKDDYFKNLKTSLNTELKYIYGQNVFSRRFKNIKAYLKLFGCEDVTFTGSKKEFLGINRGYFDPIGMHKDRLSNLTGVNIESCLCTSGKIRLDSYSEREVYVIFGYDDSLEGINLDIRNFMKNSNLFSQIYKESVDKLSNEYRTIQIKTKDSYLDALMNLWIFHQNSKEKFFLSSSKYGELHSCVDIMEKCLIYNYIDPIESKKNIIKVFSNMYVDGKFRDRWSNLIKNHEVNDSLYDGLWILFVLLDYIQVTGDMCILNTEIKFYSDDDCVTKTSTLYEKCLLIMKRGIEFDNLDIPKISNGICDTKGMFMFYRVLGDFERIFDVFNDKKHGDIFTRIRKDILNILPKYFNGEFYVDNLNCDSLNKISLITQALYIICIDDNVNSERVVSSIEKYLVNKEYGFVRENFMNILHGMDSVDCFQDSRSLIFLVKALAKLKLNGKAYSYLKFLNPILKTLNRNLVNQYRKEPYIVPSKIEFRCDDLCRVVNEDFNHVSSLFYRVVMQDILGFNLCEDGFYISPCMPSVWNNYSLVYLRKDVEYKIIVRRGESRNIKINGERCVENLIKFGDKGKFVIDVTV